MGLTNVILMFPSDAAVTTAHFNIISVIGFSLQMPNAADSLAVI